MQAEQTVQKNRMPLENLYTNDELIGKHVRIISKASYKNYRKFGRIVGFTKKENGMDWVKVYIGETQCCANFSRSSLELLN